MSGFIRRFSSFPPIEVLTAIEGINIIDLAPPAAIQGVDTNVIALVGEFADMTYAVAVDSSGVVSSKHRAIEVFSGQDLINKVGGWDSTLGQFGGDCGNGYAELRNKVFGRLVLVPVNLASASGVRFWRDLPTNKSATDATPVVPLSGAQIDAGRLFKATAAANSRIKPAARVNFTAEDAYATGVDGDVTTAAAAATQAFTSASGAFLTIVRPDGKVGVEAGDILSCGVIGAAGANGDNAFTLRVVSATATILTVQRMNGANFAFTTGVAIAWRLHTGKTADSYGSGTGATWTAQGSHTVPVRPLTDGAGVDADGTWATGTLLDPVVVPTAGTATSWDPLSGLGGRIGPTTAVAYTKNIQGTNAPNHATLDVLYGLAFDALLVDDVPAAEVSHVWPARKSSTIRTKAKTHCLTASENGVGRTCSISPELDQAEATAITTVTGNADPGVGANRDERTFYDWPPVQTFVPEAVNVQIRRADGSYTSDGMIDTTADGWMSSILGNLAPERNPGESSATTKKVLAPIVGYAKGVPTLDLNVWKLMRSRGIAGIRMDRTVGPVFQSGVTTSTEAARKNINRRKFADFVEDSIAQALKPLAKLPYSEQLEDSVVGQIDDFLSGLLSEDNKSASRIAGYLIDDKSGNTPAMTAKGGIIVIIVKVKMTPTADFLTIQCEVGEGVVTTTQLAA